MTTKKKDTNPLKEFDWIVCGKKYTVRPTWEVIARIETSCDRGMVEILMDFTKGKVRITDMAYIVTSTLDDNSMTVNNIGEDIMKRGIASYIAMTSDFLSTSMNGSDESFEEGEEKNEGT